MKNTRLLDIFTETKQILCKYDYYIHTPKKILHLTNSDLKLPHLMGLQYIGKKDLYTGDKGVYAIKKGKLTMDSIEKFVRKFYKSQEKQEQILKLIHLKLDHLYLLNEMFTTYSQLYLFDVNINPQSEFDSDYLLIHKTDKKVLHLGIIKAKNAGKDVCHCNSFMTTYIKERDYDILYRELQHKYEITKIIREDKQTKRKETIYQSNQAELRELSGIEKMLETARIEPSKKLLKMILKLNVKFGIYHTIDMLNDADSLLAQCNDKREETLVKDFLKLWH